MNMHLLVGYHDWRQLREMVTVSPPASVLLAWKLVHILVYREAHDEKALVTEDWETELPTIAIRLGSGRRVAAVLEDLMDIRDRAENGNVISRSQALEYIDAAEVAMRGWLEDKADPDPSWQFDDGKTQPGQGQPPMGRARLNEPFSS